jgi:hypothetical protein
MISCTKAKEEQSGNEIAGNREPAVSDIAAIEAADTGNKQERPVATVPDTNTRISGDSDAVVFERMTRDTFVVSNIFEGDIFDGIGETYEFYLDNPEFTIKEEDDLSYYRGVSRIVIVESKDISVDYYYRGQTTQSRPEVAVIKQAADMVKWGKYIGMDKNAILSLFDHPFDVDEYEIYYENNGAFSDDAKDVFDIFVTFKLNDGIVEEVVIGHNP